MKSIDINCDLGESFGHYHLGNDKQILKHISSANIACGFHAGDPLVIKNTIEAALSEGVSLGAHPGFPDLNGFGRRVMKLTDDELYSCVLYQVSALKSMAEALGGTLNHVKPHGAMYNMAAIDVKMALVIARAIQQVDDQLMLVGLANSEMIKAAQMIDLPVCNEVFADRRYTDNGFLVPRSHDAAVIHDEAVCVQQVRDMLFKDEVISISGKQVAIKADTICIHGDNAEALQFAKKLNASLAEAEIIVSSIN